LQSRIIVNHNRLEKTIFEDILINIRYENFKLLVCFSKMKKLLFLLVAVLILTGCKNQPTGNNHQVSDADNPEEVQEENPQEEKKAAKVHTANKTNHLTFFDIPLIGKNKDAIVNKLIEGVSEMKPVGKDKTQVSFCGITFNMNISWNQLKGQEAIDSIILFASKIDKEGFDRLKNNISERYGNPTTDDFKDATDKTNFSGHCEWKGETNVSLQTVKMNGEDGVLLVFAHN